MQEMLKRRQEVEVEGPLNLMASSSSTKENSGGGGGGGGGGGAVDEGTKKGDSSEVEGHPYDFHVSGPRNLSSPNWKDLIRSSWRDPNYKRMVIACFIQAVYLLELDRQEKRTEDNGLAPKWWKPFKYKVTKTLIDDRDGSIYGAILEWDRYAALSEFIVVRPSGAPRAVLALRGTILKTPKIRRDLQDDLRFLAWESLKGSIRFSGALAALRSAVDQFGSSNVCIGGHSLGAGFAHQIGKALATEGVFVECHLFNPPSVSLAMSLKNIGEMAGSLWSRVRAALPLRGAKGVLAEKNTEAESVKIQCTEISKWVPHLYVNNSDYICCYYSDPSQADAAGHGGGLVKGAVDGGVAATAKLFVMSNGPKKFLEAHGLQQWWSDDMELKLALNHSNLINRQLRSLYASPVAAAKMLAGTISLGADVEDTRHDPLR